MSEPVLLPLHRQLVIVTGGARGLGRDLVKAFLGEGARVVINYHTSANAAAELAALAPGKSIGGAG